MRAFPIVIMVLCVTTGALADSAGVFPVRGTNLDEGEGEAIGVLVGSAYSTRANTRVLYPADTAAALEQAGGNHRDAAASLGLDEYITVEAVRLEERVVLNAVLHDRLGTDLYRVQATAASLDDMQPVTDRIAASLHLRKPLDDTRTLDNVTGLETRRPNRTFAEQVIGIRTALALPLAADVRIQPALLVQFDGRLEATSYFLEFAAGLMLPSDLRGADDNTDLGGLIGHIGASYYLFNTSVAPYIGGGVSPRIMFGDYSGVGLTANAHLGLMFMRHSSSRIYVEIQIDQNVLPLQEDLDYYYDYDYETGTEVDGEGRRIYPTELSLAVGIGW